MATAYICNVDTSEILYIVNGETEAIVQDYIEEHYGAYIFDEWQVCWQKFDELIETNDTETVDIKN